SLTRLADSDCTQCHAHLDQHVVQGGKTDFEPAVNRFPDSHPEFRRLATRAAGQKLKFDHKLHLSAGMATPEKGDPHFTWNEVAQPWRGRLMGRQGAKDAGSLVRLDCAACHQLDSGAVGLSESALGLPAGLFPERSAGAYMLPINYEAHCQGCHPLTF